MANGGSKYPRWLVDEMGDELRVIEDIELCRKMGWTLTELDEQPLYEVQVARQWLEAQAEGEKLRMEKLKKQQKKRARRGRGRR